MLRGGTIPLGERERLRTLSFLDSKTRTIGIDTRGIEQQLRENDRRAAHQNAADAAELERLRAIADAAEAADKSAAREKRKALAGLTATWDVQRDLSRGREWDLNDPKATSKSTLPRNTDPLWSTLDFAPVSGLQVFDAELLEDPAIPVAKRDELVKGLDAGSADAARRRANEETSERSEAVRAETMRRLADASAAAEAASAAASRAQMRRDNEALAATASERAGRLREATAAAEARQVDAVLSDPMLREDTRTSVHVGCPLRFRPDHFRGLSAAQREDIRQTQRLQMDEAEQMRAQLQQQRRDDDSRALAYDAAAVALQAAADRERTLQIQRNHAELRRMAEAKRASDANQRAQETARQRVCDYGILAQFGTALK